MRWEPTFCEEGTLAEYPRPQFRRESYLSLNGTWQYAITRSPDRPAEYDGDILVPYSPESSRSGVGRMPLPTEWLHYRRTFTLPEGFFRGRLLLNVGACDQVCSVVLNGVRVGGHEGGYLPFTIDLTAALREGENELCFAVHDDASSDVYGRGKQRYRRGGIWYTAISGLWQSVWLESVPKVYLDGLVLRPDPESKTLTITCHTVGDALPIDYAVYDGEVCLAEGKGESGIACRLDVGGCLPWSPQSPELYRIVIAAGEDKVESYFGLRSFTRVQEGERHYFAVNGTPIFENGLLDQGYWGEGIYTPSCNREMYDCLKRVREMGFNMLRKHIKVEPMLWYYYCDVLGILVWQDMVNGGGQYPMYRLMFGPFVSFRMDDGDYRLMRRSNPRSREQFIREAEGTIEALFNCVSLCLWTVFNEGWGQFDSLKVWEHLRTLDDTRLFDHASGWIDKGGGDVCSRHIYFRKVRMKNDARRALALTEFGGYSFAKRKAKHKTFSYRNFRTQKAFVHAIDKLYLGQVLPVIRREGLCAIVYTQLADVEDEVNGLFTADWQYKVDPVHMRATNEALYAAFDEMRGARSVEGEA